MTHFDLDTFWHRCFEFWILSFELSAFSRFWVIKFWVLKFWIFYEKLIQNSIIQNARSAQFLLRQASLRAERKNHNSKNKNHKTCICLKANHLQRRVLKLAPLLTDNCCKRAALFVTLHRDKTKRRISTITVKRSLSCLCNNIFCPWNVSFHL